VIRALLGVKATMTDTELSRPFVALKPVFTGEFNDAELNREVALMLTAHEAGMDVAQLFGRRAIGQHQIDLRGPAQLSPPTESTARRISPEDAAAMADALDAEHEEEPSQAGRQQAAPEPAPTVRFEDLDDESQASALIKLAKQKGKLGNEKDQISADWIRKQPPIRRVAVREKLIPLPDDTDTDDLPPFMR
jgi:hypothetical protein